MNDSLTNSPVARVKKIIQADDEHIHISNNASFAIAMATEMFIQHLATTTHNVVKTERKPRRNIQYRDVSTAVAKTDNLEFLVDVVPKTQTWKDVKKKREEQKKAKEINGVAEGKEKQTTLSNGAGNPPETNGHAEIEEIEKVDEEATEAMEVDEDETLNEKEEEEEQDPAAIQLEMEMRGPRINGNAVPIAPAPEPSQAIEVPAPSGFTAINGTRR